MPIGEQSPPTSTSGLDFDLGDPIGPAVGRALKPSAQRWPIALLAPAAVGGWWLARAMRERASAKRGRRITYGVGAAILAGVARWQLARHFTDTPTYEAERRVGGLEIRRYRARIEAETEVVGSDFDTALDEGFRRLFGYITGQNHRNATIPMTGPVTSLGTSSREKIAMTAPVTSLASRDGYAVAFIMPPARELSSLPEPNDPRVVLRTVPEQRVASLRFGGRYGAALVRSKQTELLELTDAAGLQRTGPPRFAGYDAPWTLPFLRRNEVWVTVS